MKSIKERAEELVSMVCATMALEGQGISLEFRAKMVVLTIRDLKKLDRARRRIKQEQQK